MTVLEPLDDPWLPNSRRPSGLPLVPPVPAGARKSRTHPGPPSSARKAAPPTPAGGGRRRTRPLNLLDPDALPRRPRHRRSLSRGAASFLRARLRTRVAVLLACSAVAAVGATIALTLPAPAAPVVVPYPTVTGRSAIIEVRTAWTMNHSQTAGHDRSGSRHRTPAGLLGDCWWPARWPVALPCPASAATRPDNCSSNSSAVSEAATANDPAGSWSTLTTLLTRLDAAAASGEVSLRRHQSIKASIDAVRANLPHSSRPRQPRRRKLHRLNRLPRSRRRLGGGRRPDAPAAVAPLRAPTVAGTVTGNEGEGKGKG